MSYTFSDNHEVDYPALGMCDTCGKRFTQGCEHSNTLEAQQWLAAYIVAEQGNEITEEDAGSLRCFVAASLADTCTDSWADERLDNGLTDDVPYRAGNTDGEMPL